MKKNGILNSHISKVLADLGHTDKIAIGDCGLPTPKNVEKIDLALRIGEPKFINVLEEVLKDLKIEKVFLSEEIKEENPEVLEHILDLLDDDVLVEYTTHEEFKKETSDTKAVIRIGEASPYANIILQSNVIF